jgi:hypothetical protein
MIVGQF